MRIRKRTWNYIIDDLIHPELRKHPELKLLDIFLHFMVEDNPAKSVEKTLRYDTPFLMKKLLPKEKGKPVRRRKRLKA